MTGVRDFKCPYGMDAPLWRRWAKIPKPGDTVHYIAHITLIGPLFKAWLKMNGSTCKCEARRRSLNKMGWPGCVMSLVCRLKLLTPYRQNPLPPEKIDNLSLDE